MIDPVIVQHDRDVVLRSVAGQTHSPHDVHKWIPDAYVVMLFHTPFLAKTVNGMETGEAGQMLINPPGRPAWHRGVAGQGFCNDWLHLAEDAVRKPIEQLNLPIDQMFSVSNTHFVARIIKDLWADYRANAPDRLEMRACRATELLLLIRRYFRMSQRMAATPVEHAHYERLCSIREKLHEEFTKPWRVETMAAMANLSRSRFAELYSKFFDISPAEDLTKMRLDQARLLLDQGAMTVTEVAEACGYDSLNYFSRLFKARTGQSPREYRGCPVHGQG